MLCRGDVRTRLYVFVRALLIGHIMGNTGPTSNAQLMFRAVLKMPMMGFEPTSPVRVLETIFVSSDAMNRRPNH